MPIARSKLTRPLPRPALRRPRRPVLIEGGPGATTAQVIFPWNFSVRVWIAFDAPTAPLPTWIEVTGFIEHENPITITHGRTDGIADVNASTLSLTADNSDGRWSEGNPNGAWFGQIHKGCWIKVDVIPPSGLVSTRFVGFTTDLPTGWAGQYASSQITASDRFEKLQHAKAIISQIQAEVLTDPNLAGAVKGYWNLHEASLSQGGQTTFGDTSGQSAAPMTLYTIGAANGTGFAAANANSPGFDATRSPTFSPPGGAFSATGSYLSAPITAPTGVFNTTTGAYAGLYPTVELWFKPLNAVEGMLFSLIDQGNQFTIIGYYNNGWVHIDAGSTTFFNNNILFAGSNAIGFPRGRVDDGNWHHLIAGAASTNAGGGWLNVVAIVDGQFVYTAALNGGSSGTCGMNFTQLTIGGALTGASPGSWELGASDISDVAYYWADLAGFAGTPPDAVAHYATGATGNYGETTDARTARVARYAGVPVPLTSLTSGLMPGKVMRYAAGAAGPWTNLTPGAHPCGTQSMSARKPLDVAQEAARTEGMPLYVDCAGYLALQPSTLRQNTSPAWTVDARDLDPSTGQINNFTYLTNQMTVTPNGQAAQLVVGPAGQASYNKYGEYDGSQATANLTPAEARSLGLGIIALRADPPPRLSPVVVEVATLATQAGYGPAWYDAVLATEISTPIRITNTPAAVGGGTADAYVEGWQETLTSGTHTFSFATSPLQGPTYQLDSPSLGLIDTPGITLAY